jgi:hypothetical protein
MVSPSAILSTDVCFISFVVDGFVAMEIKFSCGPVSCGFLRTVSTLRYAVDRQVSVGRKKLLKLVTHACERVFCLVQYSGVHHTVVVQFYSIYFTVQDDCVP